MPKKGENIYKRKDGRWEGRYIRERTFSGKAVYGYVYARTYNEVKCRLAQARSCMSEAPAGKNTGGARSGLTPVLLKNASIEWLANQQPKIKESTYNKYKNLISSYILPFIGQMPLSQVTDSTVERFCNALLLHGGKKGAGLSPKTVADTLSVVRQILRFSDSQGYRPAASAAKVCVKREEKELRVLSSAEHDRLCAYLMARLNHRNIGILLCLFTGLRLGELCALTWEDISLNDRTVHVYHTMQRIQTGDGSGRRTKVVISAPKSKCSIRTIPLTEEIASILSANKGSGFILSGSKNRFVEPRTMQNYFKRVVQQTGIRPANFHSLRHSFATRCIELGFDVKSLSEILGHASVNITMNRYVHPSMKLKRQNMQLLSQLIAVK